MTLLFVSLLAAPMARAAEDVSIQDLEDSFAQTAFIEITSLAYREARRDMTAGQWNQHLRFHIGMFRAWSRGRSTYEQNWSAYLNSHALNYAKAARHGDIPALKRLAYFLALYVQFRAAPHPYIHRFSEKYQSEIQSLWMNFSWERLSYLVRNAG
jgi:hypothetical protein